MKITKIYFDMDSVLADFENGVRNLCHMEPVPHGAPDEDDNRQWEAIKNAGHFYDRLDPMPGAVEMFKKLSSKYDCEILTAVPKAKRGISDAGDDKIKWAHRFLSENVKVNIVLRKDKENYAKSKDYILIDDLKDNIEDWENAGGTGVLFENAEQAFARIMELETDAKTMMQIKVEQ